MTDWQEIWDRLGRGEHAVTLGTTRFVPPEPGQIRTVVVDCDLVNGPAACLEEARRQIEALSLDNSQALIGSALAQVRWHVRRRLLGDTSGDSGVDRYRDVLGRVRDSHPPTAIVFRAVDRADPTSLALLGKMLSDPLGLPIGVLFCFDAAPVGEARGLLETLQRLGHELVVPSAAEAHPSSTARGPSSPAATLSEAPPDTGTPQAEPSRPLPVTTRVVLRAAATMGELFESDVLATLLGMREIDVLVELQRARDLGVPLEDRGAGRFRLERGLALSLRAQTLPSLAHAWHRQLAELFGGLPQRPAISSAAPEVREAAAPAVTAPQPQPAAMRSSRGRHASIAPEQLFAAAPGTRQSRPDDERDWARALAALTEVHPKQGRPLAPTSAATNEFSGPYIDELRAASHAEAVGDVYAAVENYLRGAERAASNGAHELALEYTERAQKHLTRLPASERAAVFRLRSLLLSARSRWLSLGPGQATTLESALEPLETARPLLGACRAEALAEFTSLYASICYDIGSPEALERALVELTQAVKALLAQEEPLLAAQLLNDEAAVWVRIGDPVRAHHLLDRSRAIFAGAVASHPAAARELAETEHLMARLLLSARPRAGKETDALRLGVEHALSAEEGYAGLGDRGQLARVWETLGRLEARLAHNERAAQYLARARSTQVQLGDALGLARSAAALADVFAAQGQYHQALEQLGESIELNLQKGSAAGLGFNLESLQGLRASLPDDLERRAQVLEAKLISLLQPRSRRVPVSLDVGAPAR